MQLHQLSEKTGKRVQRIARGGKRGTTAGRGTKGQKSRAGRRIRPAYRDLINRIPKKRGFRNKPKGPKALALNLGDLKKAKLSASGKGPVRIDRAALEVLELVPRGYAGKIKLLGNGELDFPITVHGILMSASVKAKIEKTGGKVAAVEKAAA